MALHNFDLIIKVFFFYLTEKLPKTLWIPMITNVHCVCAYFGDQSQPPVVTHFAKLA